MNDAERVENLLTNVFSWLRIVSCSERLSSLWLWLLGLLTYPLLLNLPQNVHHAGQPMPGEEQEDIIMTSTESSIKNLKCPLTGKHITELTEPVRSMDCKHIYEKNAILIYIKSHHNNAKCPESACPKMVHAKRVICDPLLLVEIEEQCTLSRQTARTDVVEDFTEMEPHDEDST
ncbi:hypothetical protein Golax_017656 [Gossypium laxum]|uniref:SP-RING-type domain-containing protein n=1 Tax=Gossypium laxum TaxID=34288 RepID=A0A7J8Z143_9ROSI|nr:hypothetical protein [Gossypium laxum]